MATRQLVSAVLNSVSARVQDVIPSGVSAEALADANRGAPAPASEPAEPEVPPFVSQLTSMGYSQVLARRAVQLFPNSNEQALEHCLTHQDEDELELAIQLSLQANESEEQETSEQPNEPPQPDNAAELAAKAAAEAALAAEKEAEEKKLKEEAERKRKELQHQKMVKLEQMIVEPIKKTEITKFTSEMIPGCLQLLDDDPDTVYRISDLLIVTIRRNGSKWQNKMLTEIVFSITQIAATVSKECDQYLPGDDKKDENVPWIRSSLMDSLEAAGFHINTVNNSRRLATGLLLLTLLFDEARMACVRAIDHGQLMTSVLSLLAKSRTLINLKSSQKVDDSFHPIPKWISSALLLLDLYQKTTISDLRSTLLEEQTKTQKLVWMWFDCPAAKWQPYADGDQATLTNAYKNGENLVKLTQSRRKYTIYLSKMIQITDESHSRRPIMKKFVPKDESDQSEEAAEQSPFENQFQHFMTLTEEQAHHLITCCISLITMESIDSDTLNSCLRICLRLTREHKMALMFAENGGLEAIYALRDTQAFTGFYSLVSLLIRHILETPEILLLTVEKTLRSIGLTGAAHHASGVTSSSSGREFNYLMRALGPIACRSPKIFVAAVKTCLKIQLRAPYADKMGSLAAEQEEKAILDETAPQFVTIQKEKSNQPSISLHPTIEKVIISLIRELFTISKKKESMEVEVGPKKEEKSPLMTQNILLRILGEIVTSYPHCAATLTQYQLESGSTTLQYVMDNLLMNTETGKPEQLALNFLSCFANCDSNKVQNKFVVELKAAIYRVLQQPETLFKHQHLRALLDLISSSVEAGSNQKGTVWPSNPPKEYNLVSYLMVKRGLALDLAKLTHSLDLSSPHLATTLNAGLKALEVLSKVAGYSCTVIGSQKDKKKSSSTTPAATPTPDETVETPSETFIDDPLLIEDTDSEGEEEETQNLDDSFNQEEVQEGMMDGESPDSPNSDQSEEEEESDEDNEDDISEDDDDDDEPETFDVWPNLHMSSGLNRDYERFQDHHPFGGHHNDFEDNDLFQMTIDEFMYPPSGGVARRRASNAPWHQLVTGSITGSNAMAHRRPGQSANANVARSSDSNSVLAPLNTFHPLLNRSNTGTGSTSTGQDGRGARDRPGMPLRMPGMSAMSNHPNLLVRSHYLFSSRLHFVPPNHSRLHHVMDGARSLPQRSAALTFEDLVPDLQWAQLDPEVTLKTQTLFPNAFFRWAEETAVLDGPSMHDLVMLLKPQIYQELRSALKIEIEKRRNQREERRKKQKESEKKTKKDTPKLQTQEPAGILMSAIQLDQQSGNQVAEHLPLPPSAASNQTAGNTPTNTPATTTGNTPVGTCNHTPTASEPNTRPDSPVGQTAPLNHDDQLQAVSEELDQHQSEQQSQENEENDLRSFEINAETVSDLATATSEQPTEEAAGEPEQPAQPLVSPWNDVDPTFLAALPDDIRGDVIRERANQVTNTLMETGSNQEQVSIPAEFLQALPSNIRDEVQGAHENAQAEVRRRQQAQAAASSTATPNAEDDPTSFFQSLDPRLRQQILSDLDSESINRLPSELATEARNLQLRNRTEFERRQYRFLQQRTHRISRRPNFTSGRSGASQMMRNSRLIRGGADYQRAHPGAKKPFPSLSSKHLFDADSLSCLLVLLFINDSGFYQPKLHRVLKNMFTHKDGRKWITNTLVQIIQKTHESSFGSKDSIHPQWLSLKLEASLGTRHGVFHLENNQLNIHSQAASYVCRATLDSLIYLAKVNPYHFVWKVSDEGDTKMSSFWDVLMRLESEKTAASEAHAGDGDFAKPKKLDLALGDQDETEGENRAVMTLEELNQTTFARLLRILKHPVVRDNRLLIDKMLNLLAQVASHIPVLWDADFESEILKDEVELVVEILTSHLCSDEGLEDCTEVLIAISMAHLSLRIQVLRHLLKGATKLGESLKCQISQLLVELRARNADTESEKQSELQLPAMQLLTSKTSHQAFFLRILKVIVQLRKKEITLGKKRWCDHRGRMSNWDFGMGSSGRSSRFDLDSYRFDETINNAIHAAITRNSPDAAETVIHVLEGMATASSRHRHDRESLLEYISSRGGSSSWSQRMNNALNSATNQISTTKEQQKDQSDLKEQETKKKAEIEELNLSLEQLLSPCADLWDALSNSLLELDLTRDNHAFLVLQPAVEAFFIVHASHLDKEKREDFKDTSDNFSHINSIKLVTESADSQQSDTDDKIPENEKKFVKFAEKHRAVLNQILRQSNVPLSDGPFAILTNHIKILDFDVKRRFFRQELDKIKEKNSRGDMAINVSRNQIFDDSFRELNRKTAEEWKSRLYIVFDNEEGQDAGGLLREWFLVISRQMFNPNYALFQQSPTDKVTYRINPLSWINTNHMSYFKFVGRVVAKAIYDNKLLECYFTRAFYKHILGVMVTYKDMESEDYSLYQSLVYMLNNPVADLGYEITFSIDVENFGVTQTLDLKENGRNIAVTDENKLEYVQLVCQVKLTESIKEQLRAFLEGFYDIIPKKLVSIFDEHELELLISGLPNVDIDDLKANTEYHKYQPSSLQIQWFWRALKSFDQSERAKFLQFVTGTSKVPLQGFAHLEGMNGTQKFQIHRDDRETTRLPCAHTCFNQLDLPAYENYDFLRSQLLLAINEGSEGFGLA